ncbi:hypothetical protein [Polynucleobacter antarcticus]|uniref:Uncharacterized protein n=1 Tax=Polynucleobacter antarcticus TaxID=1743162 RepID=A0A6M9PXP6_9BURK|nr:hypothetical protein [Polynucleobacter antarcticus]QKM62636.1 hypothetical protein DCO16_05935 [Polynucleobacter antarcticus]
MFKDRQHKQASTSLEIKIKDEAKKALFLTAYFGVWFCAISFLGAALLHQNPILITMFGFALLKAALCAKFMLLGQAMFPIQLNKEHGIIGSLIGASLFYLVVVLILSALEEGVKALIHGHAFVPALLHFFDLNPMKLAAQSIIYWLIVWPCLIFSGLKLSLGDEATHDMLFGSPKK